MANILDAIINLTKISEFALKSVSISNNRINSVGDSLEVFIKLLFANAFGLKEEEVLQRVSEVFSYIGNKNNPPDAMLINGDAIEIKKVEINVRNKISSELQLNSSYPHRKLSSSSSLITSSCKEAEDWKEKDMLYIIGAVKNKNIKNLIFVDGAVYAANEDTYLKIKNKIKDTLENDLGLECAKTNELARINKVDPLGITSLRVRGMWLLKNPWETFEYIYKVDDDKKFNFCAIISKEKFESFANKRTLEELASLNEKLKIEDTIVKNPNNPAKLLEVKLITYSL